MKKIELQGITYIELVRGGTSEWYWATDCIHGDLYEAQELFEDGHPIQSNSLFLIHYPDGKVYEPIPKVPGQYLGAPVFDGGSIALLVVNFADRVIRILRFHGTENETKEVAEIPLSMVKDCQNLILYTAPLMLTRQSNDNRFEIFWPLQKCFAVEDRETFLFCDGDDLYFSAWYEDPDYREEVVIRSIKDGSLVDKYPGNIYIMPNGDKWLVPSPDR